MNWRKNFSDIIIRLNRTKNGKYTPYEGVAVTCAIWSEGALEKKVFYRGKLLHYHPAQHYSCTIIEPREEFKEKS